MAFSLLPKAESPYREFTHKPINRYNAHGPPFDVPVTLTDRDSSLIHEREGQDLLYTIITHNDVEFLEKYFAIDPRAIPNLFELPDGDEAICDFGNWFRSAAASGSLGTLQTLFNYTTKGLDTTKPIRLVRAGFQLLNVAAQFGHIEIVQWLLDTQPLYASIHDRDFRGFTALAAAANLFAFQTCFSPAWDEICFDNNETIMNLLLDHGASASDVVHPTNDKDQKAPTVEAGSWELDFRDQRNFPVTIDINALFLASYRANPGGVKTLVDRRGDGVDIADMVCSPDCVGSLPLHWAARNQLPDGHRLIPTSILHERAGNIARTIEQLLDFAPTTVNVQDNDGNTALHYATRHFGKNGKIYTPVFELLCSRGADPSLRNYKDETPLHTLFQSHGDDASIDPVAVSLILAYGAKVTDETTEMSEDMMARLVKAGGADLMHLPNADGETARQICQERNDEMMKDKETRLTHNRQRRTSVSRHQSTHLHHWIHARQAPEPKLEFIELIAPDGSNSFKLEVIVPANPPVNKLPSDHDGLQNTAEFEDPDNCSDMRMKPKGI
ncbi:ankyrin repeat-containing domain protein [Fusarium oxysporum]|nr:ankyrin repeat-containing domain protein [Fusarium oxysporum]